MRLSALAVAAGLVLAVPVVWVAAAAQAPNAAPTEAGTAAISGVVTDAVTKAPLQGAIVFLGPASHGPPDGPVRQVTDARGRFVFQRLPAFNAYFVNVSKVGFIDGAYGRSAMGTTLPGRIVLREGEWFSQADVALMKPSAISGRVLDHIGEPLVGVFVRVLARVTIAGRDHLIAGPVATTDDRGVYRIAGLTAGKFLVQVPSVQNSMPASAASLPSLDAEAEAGRATPGFLGAMLDLDGVDRVQLNRYVTPLAPVNGRVMVFPPTFHPGVMLPASAMTIDLKEAEERPAIDFQLQPVHTFHVSGRLDGPADALAGLSIRLLPPGLEDLGDGSEVATALVGQDGAFSFLNVPAGSYTLIARRDVTQFELRQAGPLSGAELPRPPTPPAGYGSGMSSVASAPAGVTMRRRGSGRTAGTHWARMLIVVGTQDTRDLVVRMQRTITISGRFVWAEGEQPATTTVSSATVRVEPANGTASLAMVMAAGDPRVQSETFAIEGLLPGEYVLSPLSGQGRIKSITWNGGDYTRRPLDTSSGQDMTDVVITLTSKGTILSGLVRDSRGVSDNDAGVIVFPVEREQWRNFGFSPERIKVIQLNSSGEYRFQSLPAGEYFAIALPMDVIERWKDPEFLARAASSATRISLAWGDTKTLDLRVVTIR